MSLFDQQPMGPVPARRPILMPPDPELEAAVPDPAKAEVRLVGPLPRELAGAEPNGVGRRSVARWLRVIVAALLVLPFVYDLGVGLALMILPGQLDERVHGPFLVVLAVLVATMITAQVWWHRRLPR